MGEWSCIRPGETLPSMYASMTQTFLCLHLYSFAVGLVRDEADVLASVRILVEDNSVVVVDEVKHGRENFVDLSDLKCPIEFLPVLRVKVEVRLALILDAVCGG